MVTKVIGPVYDALSRAWARLGLVERLGLLSLVIITIVGVGLGATEIKDMEHVTHETAEDFVASSVQAYIIPALLEYGPVHPLTGKDYQSFDDFVRKQVLKNKIVRLNIFSNDGTIIYADDPQRVGLAERNNAELARALRGEFASEITYLEKEENQELKQTYPRLLEIYVPVLAEDGTVSAVVEVYYSLKELDEHIAEDKRSIVLTLFIGMAVLV